VLIDDTESLISEFPLQYFDLRIGTEIVRILSGCSDQAMNREPKWSSDPVLARGLVISLRSIRDTEGRREVCVNADPTTHENDKLGACPSHASILRADPPLDVTQRLEWQMLRVKLAEQFTEIRHQSGIAVDLAV